MYIVCATPLAVHTYMEFRAILKRGKGRGEEVQKSLIRKLPKKIGHTFIGVFLLTPFTLDIETETFKVPISTDDLSTENFWKCFFE